MLNLTTAVARKREWLAQFRLMKGLERAMKSRLKAELAIVGNAAVTAFKAGTSIDPVIEEHHTRLTRIFVSAYVVAATTFAKRTLDAIRKSAHGPFELKDSEDQMTRRISDFAKRTSAKKVGQVSRTTRDQINRTITRGLQENDTPEKISSDIEERTKGRIGSARADLIARTETHTASVAGSLESVKATGIPMQKQWVAVEDDRTREDHSIVDGDVVGLDDPFLVPSDTGEEEMMFPGDPNGSPGNVCNCRCVLVYIDNKED